MTQCTFRSFSTTAYFSNNITSMLWILVACVGLSAPALVLASQGMPATPARPILERQIKVITHDEDVYCYHLNPLLAESPMGEGALVQLASCQSHTAPPPTWAFDVNGRVSTAYKGLDYCIELPKSVAAGAASWDWVGVQRCDMGERRQQWRLVGNQLTSVVGDYALRDSNYFLFAGEAGGGYQHRLSGDMATWLSNMSVPRSYNFKTDINWHDGSVRYYANYAADAFLHMRSDQNDSFTSLYDPVSKKISFQHNNGLNEDVAYCLTSQTDPQSTTWQYTTLSSCGIDRHTSPNQRWTFVHDAITDPAGQQTVGIFNDSGDVLKVFGVGGAWGYPYTIKPELIPQKESLADKATTAFFVNPQGSQMWQFLLANEQDRTQQCPARATALSVTGIPPTFDFTDAWYARLAAVGAMPADTSVLGFCGVCNIEALEIIRLLHEQLASGEPPANGHLFDMNSPAFVHAQVEARFPAAGAALVRVEQQTRSDLELQRQNRGADPVSQMRFAQAFAALVSQRSSASVVALLPDYAVTQQVTVPYFDFSRGTTGIIDHDFLNAPVGTTVLATIAGQLLQPFQGSSSAGHAFPIVRTARGWVAIEVSRPGADPSEFAPYNRNPLDTLSDAVLFYLQNREPYVLRGRNNINFALNNVLVLTQVAPGANTQATSHLSFGNCTGEGADGTRGSGPSPAGLPIQNVCVSTSGTAARCTM